VFEVASALVLFGLVEIERHRHRTFRCSTCGAGFREEHDGSLVRLGE
jgi:hypothetical protein